MPRKRDSKTTTETKTMRTIVHKLPSSKWSISKIPLQSTVFDDLPEVKILLKIEQDDQVIEVEMSKTDFEAIDSDIQQIFGPKKGPVYRS